jgi:hypothetical protein
MVVTGLNNRAISDVSYQNKSFTEGDLGRAGFTHDISHPGTGKFTQRVDSEAIAHTREQTLGRAPHLRADTRLT